MKPQEALDRPGREVAEELRRRVATAVDAQQNVVALPTTDAMIALRCLFAMAEALEAQGHLDRWARTTADDAMIGAVAAVVQGKLERASGYWTGPAQLQVIETKRGEVP